MKTTKVVIALSPTGPNERNRVEVGGTDLTQCISRVALDCSAGGITTVSLDIIATDSTDVVLEGAQVKIGGIAMPEAVKQALFMHLHGLYEIGQVDVTCLEDSEQKFVPVVVPR